MERLRLGHRLVTKRECKSYKMNESRDELTERELSFESVIERLKGALGVKTDAAVADALGMNSNAFANRKKAQSLPFYELALVAMPRGISLDWLLTGRGSVQRVAEPGAPYAVNSTLLREVVVGAEQWLAEVGLADMTPAWKGELIALLYDHFAPRGTVDRDALDKFMRFVVPGR